MAETAPDRAPTDAWRRRLSTPWKLGVVAIVVVCAAAGSLGMYADRSRLAASFFLLAPESETTRFDQNSPHGGSIAPYIDGDTFVVGMTVANNRQLPMKLERSAYPGNDLFHLVGVVDFSTCGHSYIPAECPLTELPITIGRGQSLELGFRFKLANCYPYSKTTTVAMNSLPFQTSALGIHHEVLFDLRHAVAIRFDEDTPASSATECQSA